MKKDLTRLLTLTFLGGIAYMLYIVLADMQYLTKLVHAYITMAMEYLEKRMLMHGWLRIMSRVFESG